MVYLNGDVMNKFLLACVAIQLSAEDKTFCGSEVRFNRYEKDEDGNDVGKDAFALVPIGGEGLMVKEGEWLVKDHKGNCSVISDAEHQANFIVDEREEEELDEIKPKKGKKK